MIKDKTIVVGVTGGIAAYKAAELVRLLIMEGANIFVAMTEHATKFISSLTFEALTGNQVLTHMFDQEGVALQHITWAQKTDLIVVAPATANFIGKMAAGIADDFLSTLMIAATVPVLVCPAMNNHMFANQVVQENIEKIQKRGYEVMMPAKGSLACRSEGRGRLPEPWDILERIKAILTPKDLGGIRILVTAGPTMEPLDPVRYITNRSSGKMGYAIAKAAARRGADVILVSGPTAIEAPGGVRLLPVKTAEEMRNAVMDCCDSCDVVIKAAAVADYRPREPQVQKIKKTEQRLAIELERTPDILGELGKVKEKSGIILVGFAAETQDLLENAKNKLEKKNLDMIVANDVSRTDAGFEVDTNQVKLIYKDGTIEDLPLMTKDEVAENILDRIKKFLDKKE